MSERRYLNVIETGPAGSRPFERFFHNRWNFLICGGCGVYTNALYGGAHGQMNCAECRAAPVSPMNERNEA